ncbi:hypothetical protein EC957_011588 [Mortierella hygrophila]|uniref:NAD(P)-binding domain-containing protein n=1 Tax=Mortierella hygrophila TaxID=979708 RepID=A0A9P6K3A5_9FUNG|nr:hypothetical protein EC957_011588 [Mortierella hygrophila]
MVQARSTTPPYRMQRALSMAADTKRARDNFYVSSEYPYTQQIPAVPSVPTLPPPSTVDQIPHDHTHEPFFVDSEHFQRSTPQQGDQKKEARAAARQRREQIIIMLQQQQIEAQEKAKQDKLERQQQKAERKQRRSDYKQMYKAQQEHSLDGDNDKQRSLPIHPLSFQDGNNPQFQSSQFYHVDPSSPPQQELLSSASSTTTSSSSRSNPDRVRSLSLKSNTKSMYDLRPWSGGPKSASPKNHRNINTTTTTANDQSGYDSDENSARSHGWDSLMDTLHSPTLTAPSELTSWDSKDDVDQDLMESMSSFSLSGDSGNGNGKYLLILGANGRTGLEVVRQGLERNYRVTAFVRDDKLLLEDSTLRKNQNLLIVRGSPTSQADLDRCVEGQDVVVNVIGARLMTNDATIGSHSQVVLNNALKKHGVRRLIVVTSYGCLGLRNYLINTCRLFSRVFMTGILKDKVLQEDIIQRDSQFLDWTIVRPITLKDGDLSQKYYVSSEALPKTNKVKILTRKDLAHYILTIINRPQEYNTIRSIAGMPRNRQAAPLVGYEKNEKRLI